MKRLSRLEYTAAAGRMKMPRHIKRPLAMVDDRGQSLRWVVAATTEWVTASDPPNPLQKTDRPTMLEHGLDHVVAAGGRKAALLTHQRTERELVNPHGDNQQPAGQPNQRFPKESHDTGRGAILWIGG